MSLVSFESVGSERLGLNGRHPHHSGFRVADMDAHSISIKILGMDIQISILIRSWIRSNQIPVLFHDDGRILMIHIPP